MSSCILPPPPDTIPAPPPVHVPDPESLSFDPAQPSDRPLDAEATRAFLEWWDSLMH